MIEVYDNLLTDSESNHVESFLRDPRFPWFLSVSENHYTVDEKNIEANTNNFSKESVLLSHTFYLDSKRNSDNYALSDFILDRFLDQSKIDFSMLIRSKANLQIAMPSEDFLHTTPHIDSNLEHRVLIYYANNCDGDTFIFKKNTNSVIAERIQPKKGRFVLFDGTLYHAAGLPKESDYRLNVNFNLL